MTSRLISLPARHEISVRVAGCRWGSSQNLPQIVSFRNGPPRCPGHFAIHPRLFPREQRPPCPRVTVLMSPQQTNPAKQETKMKTLRNTLAIAVTAAMLGIGAISASSPASARGFHHGGGFHRGHSHFGHPHFGHHHFGRGRGFGHRWGGHRWGYRWGSYRHFGGISYGVGAPRACPVGTHLGYNGKYCWPNRY